jgi:APA family basic amino acid/polyamine antiporter
MKNLNSITSLSTAQVDGENSSTTHQEKAASRPKIGLLSAVAFAVGTMVGAGVFVLSGPAIKAAGPGALLSYSLAGLSVLFSALSFSAVAALAPAGASGFAYIRTALGEFWGFITSWSFYIGGIIGCAFILNGFGVYLHQFFLPQINPLVLSLIAAIAMTLLNFGGASTIAKAETVLVALKVLALLFFIVMGIRFWNHSIFTPFLPHGIQPVFHESGQLFVAFLGFSVVCSMAGDIKDASKTIPTAILLSILIVALIYAGIVITLLAAQLPDYSESSLGTAAQKIIGKSGLLVVAIAALVSILSCANANILGCSESIVRLAGKREVPTILGKMYNGHPILSVTFGAVVYISLMLFGNTQKIVSYTNITTIIMLILVNLAAFSALRKKLVYKHIYPFSMLVPVVGLLLSLTQLFMMEIESIVIGILFILPGSILFLLRKRFHRTSDHQIIKEHMKQMNGPLSRALKSEKEKSNLQLNKQQ